MVGFVCTLCNLPKVAWRLPLEILYTHTKDIKNAKTLWRLSCMVSLENCFADRPYSFDLSFKQIPNLCSKWMLE